MNYTLNTTTENNVTRYLLCDSKENYYSINKLLHDILSEYKVSTDIREICENINKERTNNFLTENYIEESLEKAKVIILKNDSQSKENKKYIKHKVTIINEGKLNKTYGLLSSLFNKYVFITLSLLCIGASINFFNKNGYTNISTLYNNLSNSISTSNVIVTFLLSLVIVFVHEMGHASASFKYKVQPKEIGIGIYFIFPVLYTNVTNIWSLPAKKRMIVNLGGLYFQLLVNIFLILLYHMGISQQIILILLVFNSTSILISFNPFFRYDGYWLFSDFFAISNLREKSTAFITYAINYPTKIKRHIQNNKLQRPVIIYSILNIAFWAWVYFSITEYLIQNIPKLVSFLFGKDQLSIKSLGTLFTCFLILVWIFTAIKTFYTTLLKNNSHAKQ